MLFSVFYLSLFLSVGLLSARRAVPDGSAAVIVLFVFRQKHWGTKQK